MHTHTTLTTYIPLYRISVIIRLNYSQLCVQTCISYIKAIAIESLESTHEEWHVTTVTRLSSLWSPHRLSLLFRVHFQVRLRDSLFHLQGRTVVPHPAPPPSPLPHCSHTPHWRSLRLPVLSVCRYTRTAIDQSAPIHPNWLWQCGDNLRFGSSSIYRPLGWDK